MNLLELLSIFGVDDLSQIIHEILVCGDLELGMFRSLIRLLSASQDLIFLFHLSEAGFQTFQHGLLAKEACRMVRKDLVHSIIQTRLKLRDYGCRINLAMHRMLVKVNELLQNPLQVLIVEGLDQTEAKEDILALIIDTREQNQFELVRFLVRASKLCVRRGLSRRCMLDLVVNEEYLVEAVVVLFHPGELYEQGHHILKFDV